jgi:translation initiation factor 1
MTNVCPKCGLDKELCVCETLAKEGEKIKVSLTKRRYGKFITTIEGVSKEADPKKILKELKTKLACGGTLKEGVIELQGNHRNRVKDVLKKLGFPEEQIEMA